MLRSKARLYWALAILGMMAWIAADPPGWDLDVYRKAVSSFQSGHDPYQDEIAGTGDYARNLSAEYGGGASLYYVYSPVTLQIVAVTDKFRISRLLYWLVYAGCVLAIVLVAASAITTRDPRYAALVPPAALFFPGLLVNGTLLSGNVAIILYGLVYAGAAIGWRKNRWLPFYVAVLLCSLFKLPMLGLLAIAVFSAPKQWIPASVTAVVALSGFAAQSYFFPILFRHQLQAVDHLFSFNRDVGCSPAGIFAGLLFDHGAPYFPLAPLFFLVYALPICAILYRLSKRFLAGDLLFAEWMPVLLVGVTLLNPRLLEYDVLPITIPLALIAIRSAHRAPCPKLAALMLCGLWLAANSAVFASHRTLRWKQVECVILCALFILGSLGLLRTSTANRELRTIDAHPAVESNA